MSEKINGKYLFSFLSILTLVTYGFFVQAAFPATQYNPGETLDPSDPACTPNAANCSVAVPFLTDQVNGYVYNNNSLHNTAMIFGDNNLTWTTGDEAKFIFERTNGTVRIGSVNDNAWDPSNSGTKSVAIGFAVPGFLAAPKASGSLSLAFGSNAIASGILSTAIGASTASALQSVALGNGGTASGTSSVSIQGGNASALNAIAFGGGGIASGANAVAFFGTASAASTLAFSGTASATNALAFGSGSTASGTEAVALGNATTASNANATALGSNAVASAARALALNGATASGIDSIAGGTSAASVGLEGVSLGRNAGQGNIAVDYSVFIGSASGQGATSAASSVFIGRSAGSGATGANNGVFLGEYSGLNATGAFYSNFIGSAGSGATRAHDSNFIGAATGNGATDAQGSTFIGTRAGENAVRAANSIFLGNDAGNSADDATNSIFIGNLAGSDDTVNNSSSGNSILIGDNTSTGDCGGGVGCSNSIALGTSATNTLAHQLVIGGTTNTGYISQMVMNLNFGGTQTCVMDISGVNCSSDMRLKTNIDDLNANTLDKLMNIRTVLFNWNSNPGGSQEFGFLAQNIMSEFPQVVSMNQAGYYMVNYGEMVPVTVEAIKELNIKISNIESFVSAANKTFLNNLIAWLGDSMNGILKIVTGEVETKNLCVADDSGSRTCITKVQLDTLLANQNSGQGTEQGDGSSEPVPEVIPDSVPTPDPEPVPEVIPDSVPTPDPEPVPEVIPDSVPTPDPIPTPPSDIDLEVVN